MFKKHFGIWVEPVSPALAGRFFTDWVTREVPIDIIIIFIDN